MLLVGHDDGRIHIRLPPAWLFHDVAGGGSIWWLDMTNAVRDQVGFVER